MRVYRYVLGFVISLFLITACSPATPAAPTVAPTADPYDTAVVSKLHFEEPRGIVKGFDSLWLNIFGDTLFRLDPSTGDKQATITDGIGKEPAEMVVTDNALWVINSQSASIAQVDPKTNTVINTLKFKDICCELASFEGGVWTIDANNTLSRVDTKTNEITAFMLPSGKLTNGPFAGNNGLWVEVDNNKLVSFDPTNQTFGSPQTYQGAPIGFANDLFWTSDDKAVYGMDPKTGKVGITIQADGTQVAKFGFDGSFGAGQLGKVDVNNLWLIGLDSKSANLLVQIDLPSQKIVKVIHVGPPYYGFISMLIDGNIIWLVDDHNQVLKIQP